MILPDVHLNVAWAAAALAQEADEWDHLVFLGDYFDSAKRPPEVATCAETARFLLEMTERYGKRVTFLLGNHDLPYVESVEALHAGRDLGEPLTYCPGFDPDSARSLAEVVDAAFFQRFRLFVTANGSLLSHAGLHPSFWRDGIPGVDPLDALEGHCAIAREKMDRQFLPILGCGAARGGPQRVGGITWLDWRHEFEDHPALPPQIVGHTQDKDGVRWNGRSACVDGGQTCWVLLDETGILSIRYLKNRN
ncbi:MAG: metallophosphoesterase [Opitutales bacterium]|nr:metallophosphoesterase [Opitutales bacterium]